MLQIVITKDGSNSLYNKTIDEHYHSTAGALTESLHVYINAGLTFCSKKEITIFEMGLGSGLNAILTLIHAHQHAKKIYYIAIEKYPMPANLSEQLNYLSFLPDQYKDYFTELHNAKWETDIKMTDYFTLKKINEDIINYNFSEALDIIYYDAFSYTPQPEVWDTEIFKRIYDVTNNNGILVTYASKGVIKQNLRTAGFLVQRMTGAGGKHHCVRAIKNERLNNQ